MAAEPVLRLDRRHRRREETIEQVIDVAVEVMGEQGAAGLSLGEVARRMGVRTPSLYVYFDSKNAVYDAVFERGWRKLLQIMEALPDVPDDDEGLPGYVLKFAGAFVRWSVEHPAYSQLLFWRPVPGYQPSPAAYAPAVELFSRGHGAFSQLRDRGLLRADVDLDEVMTLWTAITSGVVSQQMSNAPDEPFETGTFTSTLPQLVDMFLAHVGPHQGARSNKRRGHAGNSRPDR